jgi:hypothetical protein
MEFGEALIANYDSKLKMYRQGISQQKNCDNVPTLSEIGCKNILKQVIFFFLKKKKQLFFFK